MKDYSKNKKYQQILISSQTLFWKYGFKKISVAEICDEANVSKMTFYRYFDNKIELVKTFLKNITEENFAKTKAITECELPFTKKIKQLILLKIESTNDISETLLLDIFKSDNQDLKQFIQTHREQQLQYIISFFLNAQINGDIRKDIKMGFILHVLQTTHQMALDEQLLEQYKTPQDLIMEVTNFFFYGLGVKLDDHES